MWRLGVKQGADDWLIFIEQGGYIQAEANGGGENAYQGTVGRQHQVVGGLSMQEINPVGTADLPITESADESKPYL